MVYNKLKTICSNEIVKVKSENTEEQFDLPDTPAAKKLMKGLPTIYIFSMEKAFQ